MASETKECIMKTALKLFAQSGYLGTSMNDIAKQLGITKAALYKHYTRNQDILNRIVERMNEMDMQRAKQFEMPHGDIDEAVKSYRHTPIEKIRAYSKAQFLHWTEEDFSSCFRKMLTLEQYRDPKMTELYQKYLAAGPVDYMTSVFREMTDSDNAAHLLALEFYGPVFLLYSIYDKTKDKELTVNLLEKHIDCFASKIEFNRVKDE